MTIPPKLDLLFLEMPEGAPPGPPISRVFVQDTGGLDHATGKVVITPMCYSAQEIDIAIDRLKGELEEIRQQAHKKYAHFKESRKRK